MTGVPVGDTTLLTKLRELNEKATPGPWEYIPGVPGWEDSFNVTGSVWSRGGKTPVVHKPNVTDALAIAAMRNALPAVVTLIEAAQRVTEDAFVNAHTDGSVTAEVEASEWKALRAALAPFVGEATQ